jgi:hypothetical protein
MSTTCQAGAVHPHKISEGGLLRAGQSFPGPIALHQQGPPKQRRPALQHLFVRPLSGLSGAELHYQVVVIAHHSLSAELDAEERGQYPNSVFNPRAAVFIAPAGVAIYTTKAGPPHTAGSDVVVGSIRHAY